MKVISIIIVALTLLTSQSLFAHSDHGHGPIVESDAQSLALDIATTLSSRDVGLGFGQLPATWASVSASNVAIAKKGQGYFIVSVLNENENKTLYILMSDGGEVYDVNFTGEFKGVE
jgi:hypothetical protein